MPEYGQPIYNNLHWKSTLDFFKEKEDEPEEGSLEEARAQDRKIIEQERAAVLANVSGAKSYEPKSEDAQFHDTGRTAPVDPKTGKVSQADLKAPKKYTMN